MRLEGARLFEVKGLEVAMSIVLFKASDGRGGGVDRGFVAAFRVFEKEQIATLDALVFGVMLDHV
jgi:hypothetical protein